MKLTQKKEIAILLTLLTVALPCMLLVRPGWFSWTLALPPTLIMLLTALARLRDIKFIGWNWMIRRLGMLLTSGAMVAYLVGPWLPDTVGAFPTSKGLMCLWGVALSWLTTPNMVPWWDLIMKDLADDENPEMKNETTTTD